jgi:D-alanyl-D-alanine carboxypeptidase (penicillin-binding protein 5/6)
MVMPVSSRITDRLFSLMVALALAGTVPAALAQQQEAPKRQQSQKPPAKPAPKPAQAAAKPAKNEPSKTEALPPSQIGIGTLAQFAFMIDPQTSTVLLFKDADKPMHPSSMAKLMTIYIAFEELAAGR